MKRRLNFDNETKESQERKTKTNPFTSLPYSSRYFEILRQRQTLPVYEYHDQIIDYVKNNTTILIEGETGSGKMI
jgi:HrpA-like RNA helicase